MLPTISVQILSSSSLFCVDNLISQQRMSHVFVTDFSIGLHFSYRNHQLNCALVYFHGLFNEFLPKLLIHVHYITSCMFMFCFVVKNECIFVKFSEIKN